MVDNNDHHNDDDDVSDHDEYKNPTDANMSVSERSKLQKSFVIAPYGVVLLWSLYFADKEENIVEIEINFITTNKVLTEC